MNSLNALLAQSPVSFLWPELLWLLLILPLLVTCVTAHVISDWLKGRPIYELLLERTLRLSGQPVPASDPDSPDPSSPVGIDEKPHQTRTRIKKRRHRGSRR